MSELLTARHLAKAYTTKTARMDVLRSIDVDIRPGEFVSIIGKSGSGKSTLLYCLSGLLRPDSGDIIMCGQAVNGRSQAALARIRRDHVGFVFQYLNLISALNVSDNIRLSSKVAGTRITRAQVATMLRQVGLGDMGRARPADLSGGQRQRVAIARALLRRPDILFADEPTGSLDGETALAVMRLMRRSVTERTALVMVTHDLDLAASADRVIALNDGVATSIPGHVNAQRLFELTEHGTL